MKSLLAFFCLSAATVQAGRLQSKLQPYSDIITVETPAQESNYQFRLGQDTSTYDGYTPLKPPFTSTDTYLKLDSFLIGLKLDDFYDFSTDCINSLIYSVDDKDYFANNRTLREQEGENWIHPVLNFTGALGGNFADALPNCYQFYDSIKETEKERYDSFDGWGDIMIAFLFNQMGNALEFQQKFENIKLDKETQNFQGVWMEYGDLVHIIWDFQKLEASARGSLDAYIAQFFPDEMIYDSSAEEYITMTALQRFSTYFDHKALAAQQQYADAKQILVTAPLTALQETNQFDSAVDTTRLLYGFMNGAVDVFPYNSLPDLCRDNVTTTKALVIDLFLNSPYVYPEDNLLAVEDFSELLTNPYGLTFSCLFGAQEVFSVRVKLNETEMAGASEQERLANELIVINDVITNFIFNLGYIYQDIAGYLTLDGANLNYWTDAGAYGGDFVMRFWYREDFEATFQYDIIADCDTTDPDVECLD